MPSSTSKPDPIDPPGVELAPTDDYGHYALGRCLEKQGKAHEANGHYKLANSLRPGKADYESRIKDLN